MRQGRACAGRPIAPERLRLYAFLTSACYEEHEAYFPTTSARYLEYAYFRESSPQEVLGFWENTLGLVRRGAAPAEMGLYVHWPFCVSRCSFCFCSMRVPGGGAEAAGYLRGLVEEMRFFSPVLRGAPLRSVYIGGGTPTHISCGQLDVLFGAIRGSFTVAPDAEVYIESSPATLTPAKMERLRRLGVTRVTLGVQSLDQRVLEAANRPQSLAGAEKAFRLIADKGDVLADVDLMLGLQGQSEASFLRDFIRVLRWGPHDLRVYAFDPRRSTAFARSGKTLSAGKRREERDLADVLDQIAAMSGYRNASLDLDDPACLCTITRQCNRARSQGASVLGIGPSAVSHAFGSAWYYQPFRRGEVWGPPSYAALESPVEEEMRGYCIRHLATYGGVAFRGFRGLFGRELRDVGQVWRALEDLEASGKVHIGDEGVASLMRGDRADMLVHLKHLYSGRVVSAMLKASGRTPSDFAAAGGRERAGVLAKVADKRTPAILRMYYDAERPRPVPGGARP
ncbi:MAG: radical SAM protein [Elusimicrobia bacterium]|nr:radical SAM protein [Elusimicrobiota bacterium]